MTSEDLYQEVLYNLWKSYPSFRGDCALSTWIYRITINTCITSFRLKNKEGKQLELRKALSVCDDDNIRKKENVELIHNIIEQLSLVDKSLMLLWLEEKSYREIAEIMGLSETNIASRLNRCKEKRNIENYKNSYFLRRVLDVLTRLAGLVLPAARGRERAALLV